MPVDVPRYDGRGILPIDVFFSFFEFTNSAAARGKWVEVGGSAPPDDGAGGLCTALGERLLGPLGAARHRGQCALGGLGAVEGRF